MTSNRLRIMHVVSKLSTYGAEHLVAELAQKLAEHNVEVSVLTVYDSPPSTNASAFRGPIFSARRRHRWDAAFFFRMVGLMRAWQPTVVHTHSHNGKYWGRLAAIASGVPRIVHTEHNSDFRAGVLERITNRLLHRASARVVAFSEPHASALARKERLERAKIAIIPNGIAAEERGNPQKARMMLGLTERDRAIFLVGRLDPVKNQALAIRALGELPPNVADRIRLFIVGDGGERAALESLARDEGVDDRVTFLGYRSDVRPLLAAADALLVTSRNEAMPLSVIEAIAAGIPVVTTPWYGVEAIVRDGVGSIASGWSPREVADALFRSLESGSTSRTDNGAVSGAQFPYDIALTAQRHIELYEALG